MDETAVGPAGTDTLDAPFPDLWRRQCARNLMDCYALGMEVAMRQPGVKAFEDLTRLMVEGMTAVREKNDEASFYRMAADGCRSCAAACVEPEKSRLFRIYAAIFEDMSKNEGGLK